MNKIRRIVRLRRKTSDLKEQEDEKEDLGQENGKSVNEEWRDSGNVWFSELFDRFPELFLETSKDYFSPEIGVGQMICGTISSYFEDSWTKAMGDVKQSKSRSGTLSQESGIAVHLKRDWHRLWIVRSFLAFCWENYLRDLFLVDKESLRDYLSLPSYGTDYGDIQKIPLGEILCIVTSSRLVFSKKNAISVPFSTIKGKMIAKKTLALNSSLHWRTPPPNTVAKFRIIHTQKKESFSGTSDQEETVFLSLNIDNPKLLWRTPLLDLVPTDFMDLQTIASSVRVLRKDETSRFIINKKNIVLKLLNWFKEVHSEINYGENSVGCRYIIKDHFQYIPTLNISQNQKIKYFITSEDCRKRRLFSGWIEILGKKSISPMLNTILEGSRKVIVFLNEELVTQELKIYKKHNENAKYMNSLGSILLGIQTGKRHFLHLEIPFEDEELLNTQRREKEKTLFFKHVISSRKLFESRIQILDDLRRFGISVILGLPSEKLRSVVAENILIKELDNDPSFIEALKLNFHLQIVKNNLFEIPYVLVYIQESSNRKSGLFFVSPCIRNNNEFLFYSHFSWLKEISQEKKPFQIYPETPYLREIPSESNQLVQMGLSHYTKGVSLLLELGGLNFQLKDAALEDLNDNRSLFGLEWEFKHLGDVPRGLKFFLHLLRTCFFIFSESYLAEIPINHTQFFPERLRGLLELLELETKKRSGSIYWSIFGILSQVLLMVYLEEPESNKEFQQKLFVLIKESMRHASIQTILLNYLVSWIFLCTLIFGVAPGNCNSKIEEILTLHRILRQFLEFNKIKIEAQQRALRGKVSFDGILNSILPIKTSRNRELGKKAFFLHLTRFYIFERLSSLLVDPMVQEDPISNGALSYYNLIKHESGITFYSLGSNKNGELGVGLPKLQLFSDLECNLYPDLKEINEEFLFRGCEEEKVRILQRVVIPKEVGFEETVVNISFGINHILILGKEGSLLTWGSNFFGQCSQQKHKGKLGTELDHIKGFQEFSKRIQEYENSTYYPNGIFLFSGPDKKVSIKRISCGGNFSLALDGEGNLYSWGQGSDGCLGIGTLQDSFVPQKVKLESQVRSFSAGIFHCAAVDIQDRLYVWGSNEFGQLGTQLYLENKIIDIPFKVTIGLTQINKRDSKIRIKVLEDGTDDSGETVKWRDISLGEAHSIGLDSEGLVWVWGQNNFKQLTIIPENLEAEILLPRNLSASEYYKKLGSEVGIPTPLISTSKIEVFSSRKVNMIFSGGAICCAIDDQGKPWVWGLGFSGMDSHNEPSIFSRKEVARARDRFGEMREIDVPVRVFRNMTADNDSIRTVRFGKGNNSVSMISRLGRCYLWSENKNLITEDMKYSNTHNCYILEGIRNFEVTSSQKKSTQFLPIVDIALLSDSTIFVTKKPSRN
ncbi:regulator of chromosome condensation family protein [Cryptosporidium felis]|nr:regulator of chromosome condensation family protein [Cryptosporidium felis]